MSFEVGASINNITDRFLTNTFVKSIAENPILTSGLISLIMIIIIMMAYGVSDSIKLGFWMFVLSTIIIFLHDRVLQKEHEADKISQNAKEIFSPALMQGPAVSVLPRPIVEGVPIEPSRSQT